MNSCISLGDLTGPSRKIRLITKSPNITCFYTWYNHFVCCKYVKIIKNNLNLGKINLNYRKNFKQINQKYKSFLEGYDHSQIISKIEGYSDDFWGITKNGNIVYTGKGERNGMLIEKFHIEEPNIEVEQKTPKFKSCIDPDIYQQTVKRKGKYKKNKGKRKSKYIKKKRETESFHKYFGDISLFEEPNICMYCNHYMIWCTCCVYES